MDRPLTVKHTIPEGEASLIAAAPQLLNAARQAEALLSEVLSVGTNGTWELATLDELRTAIAAADTKEPLMQTSALHALNHHFTLPLCKDCRHTDAIGATFVSPQCLHPKGPITRNLVTGVITGPACRDERGQDGKCGEEGRRFEPHPERLYCETHTRADAERICAECAQSAPADGWKGCEAGALECRHDSARINRDVVSGRWGYWLCRQMRSEGGACGPDGALFRQADAAANLEAEVFAEHTERP